MSFPEQMADSGGQPQLTQVSVLPPMGWGSGIYQCPSSVLCCWAFLVSIPISLTVPSLVICPQPGKLTEAFKYFLQGMGYSEYWGRGEKGVMMRADLLEADSGTPRLSVDGWLITLFPQWPHPA